MMDTDDILREVKRVMTSFPAGMLVWHRANGKRGVVIQWVVDSGGVVLLEVDWGQGRWDREWPAAVSGVKVPPDGEGEDWKTGGTAQAEE